MFAASSSLQYDFKVDVYSYAIVLWQLRTRVFPYPTFSSSFCIMRAVAFDDLRPKIDRRWSASFISLLQSCWNADPADRPSFAEILVKLDNPDLFTVEYAPSSTMMTVPVDNCTNIVSTQLTTLSTGGANLLNRIDVRTPQPPVINSNKISGFTAAC